jgi:OmpA-OmpF porin, OOP family
MGLSKRFLLGALGCMCTLSAFAQDARGVDIQLFQPAVDSRGLLTKNRSETLGKRDVSFGMWINGAKNPLVLDEKAIAEAIVTANFYASVGLFGFLEVGVGAPFNITNGPDADPLGGAEALAAQGIGDIRLHVKSTFLSQRKYKVGIGAVFEAFLPTGTAGGGEQQFMSSGVATLAPQLIIDTVLARRVKIAGNFGALIRSANGEVLDVANANAPVLTVGSQLDLGVGVAYALSPDRLDLVAEYQVLTDLNAPFANNATNTPMEVMGGIKLFLQRNSFFTAGVGVGLNNSYGAPDFRGFLGITFEPLIGDRDGDGYKDNDDKCPDDPEDFDGFEDEDGCPDPDNDGDGILDIDDACPMVPGPASNRGCPLQSKIGDRDGDGMLDNVDKCPDDPEDFDGFQDSDGCPEKDNDGDGLLDGDDECPFEAEDFDKYQDEDGCPEKDNDKDGILDNDDKCINEPEDKDDYQDEDGCPEKNPRVVLGKGKIVITEQIYFDVNKTTIKQESFDILYEVAKVVNDNEQLDRIRVEGHTDGDGSDKSNLKLSDGRSKAVVEFLVSKGGVKRDRLFAKGYGEGCPIDSNDTTEGKSRNRRSEFVILEEGEDPQGICRAQKTSAPSTFEKKEE